MNDLIFEPVVPLPVLIGFACAAAALFVWSAVHGVRSSRCLWTLIPLRLLALAAVCVVLLQPHRRGDVVTVLRPQIAVLIDNSESMGDPVDATQPTRAERIKQWLAQPAINEARKDFDVRVFGFDQAASEQPQGISALHFDGGSSNLAGAIAQTEDRFRGQPLAAVLMLTDGLDTTGAAAGANNAGGVLPVNPTAASPASAGPRVPVYTFELEKPFVPRPPPRRVALAGVDFPTRMVVDWEGEIKVNVAARGMNGQTSGVELWREGKKLRAGAATFNEDEQTRQVAFNVTHDHPGRTPYEVRLTDPAADKGAGTFPFVIDVLAPGNRIIYLQNTLGFDFKYLRKAIVTNRDLQLSAFTRWGDGRIVSIAQPGAPGRAANAAATLDLGAQGLSSCVAVVLGDIAPDALPAGSLEALRQFVDRGGGLVLLGGPKGLTASFSGTPLGEMLPVKTPTTYHEGDFPLQITSTGSHHPVFGPLFSQMNDFPSLLTCNVADQVAPTAETLIETEVGGQRKPMIVAARFGKGRVVVILSDTIWRWRLASRGWTGGDRSPYDAFWAQLMDWLAPKEQDRTLTDRIDLFAERPNYLFGEKPEVRAMVRTASPNAHPPATLPLQVQTPDGKSFQYVMRAATLQTTEDKQEPGYRVEVEPNVPGVFRASVKAALNGTPVEGEARFIVSRPATEITGRPINRGFLKLLATSNGGQYFGLDEWNNWRSSLHVTEQRFSRTELTDLWNHPLLLGTVCVALTLEWLMRKLNNLP